MKKTICLLVFILSIVIMGFSQEETKNVTIKYSDSYSDSGKEPVSFSDVEDIPLYPGGDAALMQYISSNITYPQKAKDQSIQGKVFVQFVINKKGKVTKAKIAKGVDPLLDAEALRVIQTLPDWTPGKQNGKKVSVYFVVPINFKLY